jgi:spindle assembly abnormal protein 6
MNDDFDRESPLFEECLCVRVTGMGAGRDGERPLTVRVVQAVRLGGSCALGQIAMPHRSQTSGGSSSSRRGLRLEICDEADPFFLRVLDVNEAEFATLKDEQRLMVDYADFPAHLVALLSRVRTAAKVPGEDGPSPFFATLYERGVPGRGASMDGCWIELVERTSFRDLVHLAVPVRTGNDAAVKSVLAARLHLESCRLGAAEAGLRESREQNETLRSELDQAKREHAAMEARLNTRLEEMRASTTVASSSAEQRVRDIQERHDREVRDLQEVLVNERRRMEGVSDRLKHELETLREEHRELRSELTDKERAISDAAVQRRSQEANLVELQRRLEAAEGRLREHAARETSLREQLASASQAAEDRLALVQRTDEGRRSEEAARKAAEETVELLRVTARTLQDKVKLSVAEIHKGNEVIERLRGELAEERGRRRMSEQERKEAGDREAEAQRGAAAARAETELAREAMAREQRRREEAEKALRAAEKEVEAQREAAAKHERVIEWLNKEVSTARMERTTTATALYGELAPLPKALPVSPPARAFAASPPAKEPSPSAWWRTPQGSEAKETSSPPVKTVTVSYSPQLPSSSPSTPPKSKLPAPQQEPQSPAPASLDASHVSARGAETAAGAPRRRLVGTDENPYLRPDWRKARPDTASAYFAEAE